jgi:hypothetical protein
VLQERIRRNQHKVQLQAIVEAMPAYPIYREAANRYSLYVDGRRKVFPSEGAARLEQLDLNQTGEDAVLGWAGVLAAIDIQTLPQELQAELQHLRSRSTEAPNLAQA